MTAVPFFEPRAAFRGASYGTMLLTGLGELSVELLMEVFTEIQILSGSGPLEGCGDPLGQPLKSITHLGLGAPRPPPGTAGLGCSQRADAQRSSSWQTPLHHQRLAGNLGGFLFLFG